MRAGVLNFGLRWLSVAGLRVNDLLVGPVEFRGAEFLRHVPVLDVVFRSPGVTRYSGDGLDP